MLSAMALLLSRNWRVRSAAALFVGRRSSQSQPPAPFLGLNSDAFLPGLRREAVAAAARMVIIPARAVADTEGLS